jgi:tripeptide aminopeptidase
MRQSDAGNRLARAARRGARHLGATARPRSTALPCPGYDSAMPTWNLDAVDQRALLERFLRYVRIDTRSDEGSPTHPSTDKQKILGRLLVEELLALGCADARLAESGHVYASVAANLPTKHPAHGKVPVLGFLAHLDTYPATSGTDVKPQIVAAYTGSDIVLPATGAVLPAASNPNLARCLGHTLVHTDGTTLLGADDKAGIAEIVTMVDWLGRHPEFLHGQLAIAFTPDEEIGRGIDLFDLPGFAARYAYTVDGSDLGEVEDETFSADSATVTITGHDVHPGYAKGVMVNAVRVAAAIVDALPHDRLPETTDGRQPYLHAHAITGDVGQAQVKLLVRAFTEPELVEREEVLRGIIAAVAARFPGVRTELDIEATYRNMGEHLAKEPKVVDHAMEAVRRQGLAPIRRAIRGGTDGAKLSARGLLTPNLFAGGQGAHSVREWISLEWMAAAVGVCLQLIAVWLEKSGEV